MKLLSFLFILLTLTACSSFGEKTPEIRFYSLSAVSEIHSNNDNLEPGSKRTPNLKIGIGPIKLPRQLKRPQIITRINQNELKVSEDHQWAGSLKEDITLAVADNLSALLATEQIEMFPWKRRFKPNYQVRVQIEQLDGEPGKNVTLKARWWLRVSNTGTDKLARKSTYTIATKGTDYTSYVAALSDAIDKLSQEIAQELK